VPGLPRHRWYTVQQQFSIPFPLAQTFENGKTGRSRARLTAFRRSKHREKRRWAQKQYTGGMLIHEQAFIDDAEYVKRNLMRIKTIDERINPATGKKTRSFLRTDGLPKFIERPCEFCDKLGKKDQWHFGFECTARQTVHTAWIETMETDAPGGGY